MHTLERRTGTGAQTSLPLWLRRCQSRSGRRSSIQHTHTHYSGDWRTIGGATDTVFIFALAGYHGSSPKPRVRQVVPDHGDLHLPERHTHLRGADIETHRDLANSPTDTSLALTHREQKSDARLGHVYHAHSHLANGDKAVGELARGEKAEMICHILIVEAGSFERLAVSHDNQEPREHRANGDADGEDGKDGPSDPPLSFTLRNLQLAPLPLNPLQATEISRPTWRCG